VRRGDNQVEPFARERLPQMTGTEIDSFYAIKLGIEARQLHRARIKICRHHRVATRGGFDSQDAAAGAHIGQPAGCGRRKGVEQRIGFRPHVLVVLLALFQLQEVDATAEPPRAWKAPQLVVGTFDQAGLAQRHRYFGRQRHPSAAGQRIEERVKRQLIFVEEAAQQQPKRRRLVQRSSEQNAS
jgi:hypothetical protein